MEYSILRGTSAVALLVGTDLLVTDRRKHYAAMIHYADHENAFHRNIAIARQLDIGWFPFDLLFLPWEAYRGEVYVTEGNVRAPLPVEDGAPARSMISAIYSEESFDAENRGLVDYAQSLRDGLYWYLDARQRFYVFWGEAHAVGIPPICADLIRSLGFQETHLYRIGRLSIIKCGDWEDVTVFCTPRDMFLYEEMQTDIDEKTERKILGYGDGKGDWLLFFGESVEIQSRDPRKPVFRLPARQIIQTGIHDAGRQILRAYLTPAAQSREDYERHGWHWDIPYEKIGG